MSDGTTILDWENLESEKALRLSRIEQIVCGDEITLTISVDRKLRVYDTKSIQLIKEVDLGKGFTPKRVAMNPTETNAYIGTQEGSVLGVDLNSNAIFQTLKQSAEITALAISPDGVLAVGNSEGEIELWSVVIRSDPKQLCRLVTFPNAIKSLGFSRDGKKLAVYVEGDCAGRILNWTKFRSRLQSFDLDW